MATIDIKKTKNGVRKLSGGSLSVRYESHRSRNGWRSQVPPVPPGAIDRFIDFHYFVQFDLFGPWLL